MGRGQDMMGMGVCHGSMPVTAHGRGPAGGHLAMMCDAWHPVHAVQHAVHSMAHMGGPYFHTCRSLCVVFSKHQEHQAFRTSTFDT